MPDKYYIQFTEEMKRDYTILVPAMLPIHFEFINSVLSYFGYRAEILRGSGESVIEKGLKYVHNDACYPALLTIGQLIEALQSGKYDPLKTALMMSQTGGGCRASNYVSMLRKALEKAGFGHVPVISFNVEGMEKHPGFKMTPGMLYRLLFGVLYGDLLMALKNQCLPYELDPGATKALVDRKTAVFAERLRKKRVLSFAGLKRDLADTVRDFAALRLSDEKKPKIGVVGEIYVKFSSLGNNDLEEFLISEGAEPVLPGLLDFCLYCVCNAVADTGLYGIKKIKGAISKILYDYLIRKQKLIIKAIAAGEKFTPMTPFDRTARLSEGYIGKGVKMGEGWLLTAEMLELAEQGASGIVCAQPFGCLPNHIAGKGMMKPLRDKNPGLGIVAIDYDPGVTRTAQENRIKLMLAGINRNSDKTKGEVSREHNEQRIG